MSKTPRSYGDGLLGGRVNALERSMQEVQIDVQDLLARLGIDSPTMLKFAGRAFLELPSMPIHSTRKYATRMVLELLNPGSLCISK